MLGVQGDVPEGEYIVPIGKADIKRFGKDVSLIVWSAMVPKSLAAAEMLAAEGIDAEVVDLRTLTPLDRETLLGSVERTGRAVVVHEAVKTFSSDAIIVKFFIYYFGRGKWILFI